MKTHFPLIFLLFVFLPFNFLRAQWAELNAVNFSSHYFYSISGVDDHVAWGALMPFNFSGTQRVVKTTNGGESWEAILINESSPGYITFQIFALDENTAWVVRSRASGQDRTEILKTADGGASWMHQSLPSSNEHTAAVAVHFFDENEGASFAETFDGNHWKVECYYTENGGADWALAGNPESTDERIWILSGNNHYEAAGSNIWFGTSLGRVFKSSDRGKSWAAHPTPLANGSINSIAFRNEWQGIALSSLDAAGYPSANQAFRTLNGGKTWVRCPVPSSPERAQIEYVPGSKGAYVLHGPGYLPDEGSWISVDNGNHWKDAGNAPVDCIQFLSPTLGWGGGVDPNASGASMYKWQGEELLFNEGLVNVKTIAGSGIEGHRDGPAATARFWNPMGMDVDAEGNLFIADDYSNSIRKLSPDGTVSTVAGNGRRGYANGPGAQAQFDRPQDVVVGRDGSVYVADANNFVIRKVSPEGEVSLYAGQPGVEGNEDGPALEATFGWLPTLGIDDAGNLYAGGANKIRKISPDGQVSTLANTTFVWGLHADGAGNVYYADLGQNTIRMITADGTNITIDGGFGCTDGARSESSFAEPANITTDPSGNIYIADGVNHRIRKIDTEGNVTTLAGEGCTHGFATEYKLVDGPAELARFGRIRGIFYHPNGNLLVTSWDNDAIREIQIGTTPLPVAALEHRTHIPYHTMPKHHLSPITFSGYVFNLDEQDMEGVQMSVTVKKDGITVFEGEAPPVGIAAYDAEEFTIETGFTPEEVGEYEVSFQYTAPGAGAFFTAHDNFFISESVMAADDGYAYFHDSPDFQSEDAYKSYGQEYALQQGDTLLGIAIQAFMEEPAFTFGIYQMEDETIGEQVFASESFTGTSVPIDSTTWYLFSSPIYLPPGQYLFTLERDGPAGELGLGADADRNDHSAWHLSPYQGINEWDQYFHFWNEPTGPVFMLRPVFQVPAITSAGEEADLPFTVRLSPNPVSGHLTVRIDGKSTGPFRLKLLNMAGETVKEFPARTGEVATLDLLNLSNGVYLLQVYNAEGIATKKFVKQ